MRRTFSALILATVMIASVTMMLFALLRLGQTAGLVAEGTLAIDNPPARWEPWWLNRVWVALLVVLCVAGVFLAIRHANNGGGLVGVLALVGAVPAATLLYDRVVWEYPLLFHPYFTADFVPGDPPALWVPAGLNGVPRWSGAEWWVHLVIVLLMSLVVLWLGRWLASGTIRTPRTWQALVSLWFGTFLTGYMHPNYYPNHHEIEPLSQIAPSHWAGVHAMWVNYIGQFGVAIWYASIVAVLGWLVLSANRVATSDPSHRRPDA